jgi:hypothetical protein
VDETKINELTLTAFHIEKGNECGKTVTKTCDKNEIDYCMKRGLKYRECTRLMLKIDKCGNECERLESYANLTKNVQELMNKEMNAAIFEMMVEISEIRKKRGIQLLGDAGRLCCNFITDAEMMDVKENQIKLTKQYAIVREAVIEEHRSLFEFRRTVQNMAHTIERTLNDVRVMEEESVREVADDRASRITLNDTLC